jgi:hypothetical protein
MNMKSIKFAIGLALTLAALAVALPSAAQSAPAAGLMWDGYVSGRAEATGDGGWLACENADAQPREWREGAMCATNGLLPKRSGAVRRFTLDQLLNRWLQRPQLRATAIGALPAYILNHRAKGGDDYSQSRNIVVIVYKTHR